MKIYILGNSGSGKTRLSKRLSDRYGLPHVDLDDLFWDNSGAYGQKRDPGHRDALLSDAVEKENWVIEGIYYAWTEICFEKADRILLLDLPLALCRFRVIRRFLRRKCGLEKDKKESLSSLWALLRWMKKFQKTNLPAIRECLLPYGDKTIVIKKPKEIKNILTEDVKKI